MKKKLNHKLFLRIFLIMLILTFFAVACVDGGNGVKSKGGSLNGSSSLYMNGPDATATYGAEQFHLQLTAIAQPAP